MGEVRLTACVERGEALTKGVCDKRTEGWKSAESVRQIEESLGVEREEQNAGSVRQKEHGQASC